MLIIEHGNIRHVPNEKRVSAEEFGNPCPVCKERENVFLLKSAENDDLNGMVISDQKVSLRAQKAFFTLLCKATGFYIFVQNGHFLNHLS